MDIAPLPKKIIDLALMTGVKRIVLKFSVEDEILYLNFDFDKYDSVFCKEVQDWTSLFYADATQVGALGSVLDPFQTRMQGLGTEYGETFDYNLENGTVISQEWSTEIHYGDEIEGRWEMDSED